MKFLLFVCGLLAVLGAATAGCGPQQHYCKETNTGQCLNDTVDGGVTPMDTGLGGESIIIGGD